MSDDDGRSCTDAALLALWHKAAAADGLNIADLVIGDIITVETQNSVYDFDVLDPKTRHVLMRGTNPIKRWPMKTYLHGSSFSGTGSQLRLGWIGVGYRLSVGSDLLLSETKTVFVNGMRILPRDPSPFH